MPRALATAPLLTAITLGLLALPAPTQAGSSDCGFIRDADQRALCRARASGSTSDCGFIGNSDLRSYCRAVVGKSSADCGFISDADLRSRCRAETGG